MSIVLSHETRRVAAAKLVPAAARNGNRPQPLPKEDDRSTKIELSAVLSELFAEALDHWCPESVAELAVASTGGNPSRRPALEVNLWAVDELQNRYFRKCSLELQCADLTGQQIDLERVKLVHAALVFEQMGAGQLLEEALALVAPGGAFSVVLQLPEESEAKVSRGLAPSVHRKRLQFSVLNPAWMREMLAQRSFGLTHQTSRTLASGKKLWLGIFAK